mmetsp:Transcript_30686/g.61632  ORF Transcript_30686/g.61632 Transcript_30686/m.61632 type:complete len:160 (+) Transcript_30686:1198-1677(+)
MRQQRLDHEWGGDSSVVAAAPAAEREAAAVAPADKSCDYSPAKDPCPPCCDPPSFDDDDPPANFDDAAVAEIIIAAAFVEIAAIEDYLERADAAVVGDVELAAAAVVDEAAGDDDRPRLPRPGSPLDLDDSSEGDDDYNIFLINLRWCRYIISGSVSQR